MSESLGSYSYEPDHIAFIQNEIKNYLGCDDVLSKESQPKSPEDSKKPTSRLVMNAIKQATEDTKNFVPQQQQQQMMMDTPQDAENGDDSLDNHRESKYSKSTSPTTFKVTFNASESNRKRKINNSEDLSTSDDNVTVSSSLNDSQEMTERSYKKSDKKERCQFWPLCKNGDTSYSPNVHMERNVYTYIPQFHASLDQPVQMLHAHSTIHNVSMLVVVLLVAYVPMHTGPYPECRFAKDCTNPNCKFLHPERQSVDVNGLSATLPSTPPQSSGESASNGDEVSAESATSAPPTDLQEVVFTNSS
eukprot:gene8169-9603_t